MNNRRVNSNVIVSHMPRPPQQASQWPLRVSAARLSCDPRHDVTGRPATVSGRHYNVAGRRTNVPAERARIQPEFNACWTDSFDGEGAGCRRKPLCNAKWPSKIRNDGVRVSLPVANGRRNFTQPFGGKELPVNTVGRAGRQKISCDQFLVSRGIPYRPTVAKPGVKCHNFRNTTSSGPEAEISKTQKDGETSAAAENEFIAVGDDCSASLSSQGSSRTSITLRAVDDDRQLRGRSARTSVVFSRMSTEAQRAWIAVRRPRTSAATAASIDEPETERTAHADDATSGLDVGQTTTCNRTTPGDSRRHGTKYATEETAYKVFEPRSNGLTNSSSNVRVVTVPQHRGIAGGNLSREVGSFRITSASYDSRFIDMAIAASQRVTNEHATSDNGDDNDDDDDDDERELRTAAVAKCLSWLKTQHFNPT